jgi:putative membrane protein
MNLVHVLPVVNASLNALSGLLLFAGFLFIRRRRIEIHKRFMLAACVSSTLFLISYVTYHTLRHGVVTRYAGTGAWRTLYLTILLSHTILAVTVVPLAIITVLNGLRMNVAKHRRIAKWTFPIWMYVSITGVIVYFFLYQWFPSL